MTEKELKLRKTIKKLSVLAAVVTTLTLPSVYLFTSYSYLDGWLGTEAEITAESLEGLVTENPEFWRYQSLRMEELLNRRNSIKPVGRKVMDLAGKEVLSSSIRPGAPVFRVTADIKDAGTRVAQVEISQSLKPFLFKSLALGLLGLLMGWLVFVVLRLIPLKALEEAYHDLRLSERKYRGLFVNLAQGALVLDVRATAVVGDANHAGVSFIGLPRPQLIGMKVEELFGASSVELLKVADEAMNNAEAISYEIDWSRLKKRVHISVVPTGENQVALLFEDVTEKRRDEQRVKQMAYYDTMTGLPNRILLYDRIDQALARAARINSKVAILFIDLDRFKPINDSLGHEAGDRVLEEIAKRLKAGTRAADTIARFAGDEFIMVVSDIKESANAELVAESVLNRLNEPYRVDGRELCCSCSIGISIYPDEGLDSDTLINHADLAMYAAKEKGGGRYVTYGYLLSNPAASPRNYPR